MTYEAMSLAQRLETVTWAFHLAVEHLDTGRGTVQDRLDHCTHELSRLKLTMLALPRSLSADSTKLLTDLQNGRYVGDPFRGDLAIRNYALRLKGALLDVLEAA